jgi:hypothetical protein
MKRFILIVLLAACGVDPDGFVTEIDAAGETDVMLQKGRQAVPDAFESVGGASGSGGRAQEGGEGGTIGAGGTAVPVDWSPCPGGLFYSGTCMPACPGGGIKILDTKYWCATAEQLNGGVCTNGQLTDYYAGLPCPLDVAVAMASDWNGPCQGCTDNVIITNGGESRSASYRSTRDLRYYCDGSGAGPMGNLGTKLCMKKANEGE